MQALRAHLPACKCYSAMSQKSRAGFRGDVLKGCLLCRAVEAALVPGHTRLLMLESPTNPRMQICDIQTLTQLAHKVS